MAKEHVSEEQYILRVEDKSLADRIRSVLRSDPDDIPAEKMQISFDDSDGIHGKLIFEGQEYPLTVLKLPCVTESYKTYDDINLVKTTDIGQVLLVGQPKEDEAAKLEIRDGITPPLRNAAQRLFRKPIVVDPAKVHETELALLTILSGGAPQGYKFEDHEEIWQINPETGQGEWMPASKK